MPISCALSASVRLSCSIGPMEPTMVTSSPSSTQVMPRAMTMSRWKRLQGKRSSLAGMSVSIALPRLDCPWASCAPLMPSFISTGFAASPSQAEHRGEGTVAAERLWTRGHVDGQCAKRTSAFLCVFRSSSWKLSGQAPRAPFWRPPMKRFWEHSPRPRYGISEPRGAATAGVEGDAGDTARRSDGTTRSPATGGCCSNTRCCGLSAGRM